MGKPSIFILLNDPELSQSWSTISWVTVLATVHVRQEVGGGGGGGDVVWSLQAGGAELG